MEVFKKFFGKSEPAYTPVNTQVQTPLLQDSIPQVANSNVAKSRQPTQSSNSTQAKDQTKVNFIPLQSKVTWLKDYNEKGRTFQKNQASLSSSPSKSNPIKFPLWTSQGGVNPNNQNALASYPDAASVLGLPEGLQLKPNV